MQRDRDRERERERSREASTASMASSVSSSSSALSASSSSSSACVRADGRGVLAYGSNSRYGRHRARSQLGQYPDLSASSQNGGTGSSSLPSTDADPISSPPPPPPPPLPLAASYDPAAMSSNATVSSSSKPSIVRSTSGGSASSSRSHRSPIAIPSSASGHANQRHHRHHSGGNGSTATSSSSSSSSSHRHDGVYVSSSSIAMLSDDDRREANSSWMAESPPTSATSSSLPTSSMRVDTTQPPTIERSRSGSHTSRSERHEGSSSSSTPSDDHHTPRRRARKMITDDGNETGDDAASVSSGVKAGGDGQGGAKPRPVRIKYENTTRGVGGGKREISHASLGKLIARLTDAHQYDAEFRDVFLLTYRCFCSPYDFVKKLMKRYTAVLTLCGGLDPETLKETQELLDQITKDEENDRSSTSTSISTAKSDINTGMEATVSIMRLLSVIKFWIKESGFIEMDLYHDRRAQKKLIQLLQEIQSTTPIASIRQHAESLLMSVGHLIRQQQSVPAPPPPVASSLHGGDVAMSSSMGMGSMGSMSSMGSMGSLPPPPPLTPSTSVSSVSSDHGSDYVPRQSPDATQSKLSSAMSKLKLTRSSSDSKKDRSGTHSSKSKHANTNSNSTSSGDVLHVGSYNADPSLTFRRASPMVAAPKMLRGVTTGSSSATTASGSSYTGEATFFDSSSSRVHFQTSTTSTTTTPSSSQPLEDVIHDTIQRARLTASRSSSRTSYDNVQPLSGVSAQELADQLSLIEAEGVFARINRRELTNKAWTRETKHKDAPHVMALIELFDATAEWVSSEILHPQLQAAERAKLIMLFIDAADNCYQLNNFNCLFELTTGLSAPCIRQLNTTWGLVHATSQEKYQVLMQVCSPEDNYRNYRQAFSLAEGQPRLPCSFILMKDLFTLEEAMRSMEDGLVNWQKFRKIYKAITEALERQNLNYLPLDGSNAAGISRKGKGALRHDRKVQLHIRQRLETIRKDSSVLYQLARNANTQESIMFVNSLSEAGFL